LGEVINLKLTNTTHGGEALGRDASGRVIFVPYAIAGEEVRVEIVAAKKGFARARLLEIITPSPSRVTPRCPHFGPRYTTLSANPRDGFARGCGGCQWQHIDYGTQLEFKTQIVREQFARIGKMPDAPIAHMFPDPRAWNYRNHMRFAMNEKGELCLQAFESHNLIPIRECHIMDMQLVSLFNTLELEGADFAESPEGFQQRGDAVTLRAGENTGDRLIVLEASNTEPPKIETDETVSIHFQAGDMVVPLIGKSAIEEIVRGRVFRISPRAFFQVNTPMAEILLNLVEQFLSPQPDEILLDAYGGVGLFGLSLAARAARVIEIEENVDALADAQSNARDLNNVEFHAGRVEDILPYLDSAINLAVVDPPRAGLARDALVALMAKHPRAIAYVSCDPATLARDARLLVDAGYRLERVQPVDLFPQTYHIECVAQFVRGD
jgi:23S rRNA (uracil1939-C5)-methyltransferase